jgi:hypothetical protein
VINTLTPLQTDFARQQGKGTAAKIEQIWANNCKRRRVVDVVDIMVRRASNNDRVLINEKWDRELLIVRNC